MIFIEKEISNPPKIELLLSEEIEQTQLKQVVDADVAGGKSVLMAWTS